MSEHIAHVAVFEDCCRLGLHSGRLNKAFRTVLERHWDFARFGSTSRSGDRHSIAILKYARERWDKRDEGDYLEEKLAFLIGWRCHQAADRRFKPVYRELDPEYYKTQKPDSESGAPTDVRILHDVVVYREVYGSGEWPPFPKGLLDDRLDSMHGARALDFEAAFDAVGGVWQRTLQAQLPKTFAGDFESSTRLIPRRYQRFYVDVQRYSEMFRNADPDQVFRYIIQPNFYDPKDGLISLARDLQRKRATKVAFDPAYEAAAGQSQYTQSLKMGLRYLFAASDFFDGKISEPETRKLFDLDKKHTEGGTFTQ